MIDAAGALTDQDFRLRSCWERAVQQGDSSPLIGDWVTWLSLSRTPDPSRIVDPTAIHSVRDGFLVEPSMWPRVRVPQIYVAFDDERAVYVGQTSQCLGSRIRQHFGNQTTPPQREKAGSWQLIVAATWDDLRHRQLDQLEAAAANWVLPRGHRRGRRHPRMV